MAKPKTDSETIEQALTHLENSLIDRYTEDETGGYQTTIAGRHTKARPGEPAYQARLRPELEQRIRDRIAESRVTPEEIIGTLASFMRADITQLLDESGQVDFKLIKQRRLGHLLKSVSTTVRETKATDDKPADVVKTTRIQLHSPIQAAAILARLAGIGPWSPDEG